MRQTQAPPRSTPRTKTWPVSEVFGPTIQGEGPDQGRPAYFIRLGGCDYQHCSWCDSLFSVLPEEVRKLDRLDAPAILDRLQGLEQGPDMVVLSGGNPAMHDLSELIDLLHGDYRISVETQGSRWHDWLRRVDRLVVSPKGPSSGMDTDKHWTETKAFLRRVEAWCQPSPKPQTWACLKIVVEDFKDYEYAIGVHKQYPWMPFYLSACTPQPEPWRIDAEVQQWVTDQYAWLCDTVKADPDAKHAHVQCQMHIMAWGTRRGV